jgi:iron(III) transport system ATP-binding protein
MSLLTVSGLGKQGEGNFLLRDINFTQRKFQRIAIAGETGSGKSTLLKIIAGLVQPDAGEVFFLDEKIKGPQEKLVPGHPSIAYLSQDFELDQFLTVDQVLSYSNLLSEENAQTIFQVCRISHLLARRTDQLSGGERQRIAIARLLIASPELLLLDEPYTNLDMVYKNTLKSVISDIGKQLKITCILVSHDPHDILSWASKILVMRDGRIIQKGPPKKIYWQPVDEYAAGLFGKFNVIDTAFSKSFSKLLPKQLALKKLLLRPEHIKIVARSKDGLAGKVKSIGFFGSYYEIEISVDGHTIITTLRECDFVKGDKIYITVDAGKAWHFPVVSLMVKP